MPTRTRAATVLIALLLVVTASPPAAPTAAAASLEPLTSGQLSHRVSGEVFGYLPYWSIGSWTDDYLRYDVLTDIAFFGVGIKKNGTLDTDEPGYLDLMSDRGTRIIEHAHAHGVRVHITFQSFGGDRNRVLFADPTALATFRSQARALVRQRGADGANLDIEGLNDDFWPAWADTIAKLRKGLRKDNPIARVSVATNPNSIGSRMAKVATDAGADRVFIMAYVFRTALANPVGSNDPLIRADGGLSLTTSLDNYRDRGVPTGRILLGLPFYGMTWPTVSDAMHAKRRPLSDGLGDGNSFFPHRMAVDGLPAGAVVDHDPIERSARITWYDDAKASWYQTYYDDPQSMGPKAKLAVTRGLAGMGIWALGYERGVPGYWEKIAATFAPPAILSVRVNPNPTDSRNVTVKTAWDPGAHAVTRMRLSNNGTTWSDWRTAATTTSWRVGPTNGTRRIYVQLRDSRDARSGIVAGKTVLDTVDPTVTSLAIVRQGTHHRWKVTYTGEDATSGVAGYRVSYRIGSGVWRTLDSWTTATTVYLKIPKRYTVTFSVRARDRAGNWSDARRKQTP
jgi:spore germination protein YaaH